LAKTTILDTAQITLYFHTGPRIVHHQIHKYTFGADLRAVLDRGAELLEQHQACKWLSDDRNNGPLPAEDMEWNKAVWIPRVIQAGWKYWALVLPEKAVAQMNMKRFQAEFAAAGVSVQTFQDPEQALKWLEGQAG